MHCVAQSGRSEAIPQGEEEMIKRKKNPTKPGWYVGWFDGSSFNMNDGDINNKGNLFYWTGKEWINYMGYISSFGNPKFSESKDDRWSYLPKGHPMRGKAAPQK